MKAEPCDRRCLGGAQSQRSGSQQGHGFPNRPLRGAAAQAKGVSLPVKNCGTGLARLQFCPLLKSPTCVCPCRRIVADMATRGRRGALYELSSRMLPNGCRAETAASFVVCSRENGSSWIQHRKGANK